MSTCIQASDWLGTQRLLIAKRVAAICSDLLSGSGHRDKIAPASVESRIADHISHISEALAVDSPEMFGDYLDWARGYSEAHGVSTRRFREELVALRQYFADRSADDPLDPVCRLLDESLAGLPRSGTGEPRSFLDDPQAPLAGLAREYLERLLDGDRRSASCLILAAAERGTPVADLYLHVFQRCQYEIGRLWQVNRLSVAQEHYCTAATQLIMSQLYPYVFAGERRGRTLLATAVQGDLHELGIRMVADLFEMHGWDTHYLGADTPIEAVVGTVRLHRPNVLSISATLSGHVRQVTELVREVRECHECKNVKIIVGGHAFRCSGTLWRKTGADATACDALDAIRVADELCPAV